MLNDTGHRIFRPHAWAPDRPTAAPFSDSADNWPHALWSEIAEAGLPLALLSEEQGGFGFDATEVFNLLAIAARYQAAIPLGETQLANYLFANARLPLAEGPAAVASGLFLEQNDDHWRIRGTVSRIPFGRHLTTLAAIATGPEGNHRLVHVQDFDLDSTSHNLAGEARDTLAIDSRIPGDAIANGSALVATLAHRLALVRAYALVGAMEAVLELCVHYANERQQFGRPIGKFQAIQHYLAAMAGDVAAARMAVNHAGSRFADSDARYFALAAAAAKVRAGEAAGLVAKHAHQIHGAIGFSWEYALHPLSRRLWAWREEYGNESHWSESIGDTLVKNDADVLWPSLTDTREYAP